MKSLVIIFTPLQYLNALRYFEQRQEKHEILVLTSSKKNIEQIKHLDKLNLCRFPFVKLTFLNNETLWLIKCIYSKIFVQSKHYSKIIIGNYKNIIGYYFALKFDGEFKDVVLLDDGLATIDIYLKRINRQREVLFGGHLINIYKNLLRINNREVNRLIFYTVFNISSLGYNGRDQILTPKVKVNNSSIQNNEVWFIGTPVVEQSIISETTYKKILESIHINAKVKGQILVYIMHRAEKQKFFDFKVKNFNLPLEIVFQGLNTFPSIIISFYSTALINIATTYPELQCFYINISHLSSISNRLVPIYKFFSIHENLKELTVDIDL